MTFTPGVIAGWATFQSPIVCGKRIGGWKAAAPDNQNCWNEFVGQAQG